MSKFDKILVAGDSYSANIDQGRSYGAVIADKVEVGITNLARHGSNNDRIIRSLQEAVLLEHKNGHHPLVIVGLSFVHRIEIWYHQEIDASLMTWLHDKENLEPHEILPVFTLDWVIDRKNIKEQYAQLITEDSIHKKLLDLYQLLFGLIRSLEILNIPFFIFSGARNTDCPVECFPAIDRLETVKYVKNHNGVFDLHKFCISDWAKNHDVHCNTVTGHLSPDGHEKFAEFLFDKLHKKGLLQ